MPHREGDHIMEIDLLTARVVLRAILAGMPAESALWIVEQVLDGYDLIEALEEIMKKALEGDHEKVKMLCQGLRGDCNALGTYEENARGR
jgi:hypothetical protein